MTTIHSPHRDKNVWRKAEEYIAMYLGDPIEGNYALLDVAITVCKPGRPDCLSSPLRRSRSFYVALPAGWLDASGRSANPRLLSITDGVEMFAS